LLEQFLKNHSRQIAKQSIFHSLADQAEWPLSSEKAGKIEDLFSACLLPSDKKSPDSKQAVPFDYISV
jgi:hypothetical protein